MKTKLNVSAILLVVMLLFSFNAEAQFLKRLAKKADKALSGDSSDSKSDEKAAVVDNHTHNPWQAENLGKIKFYNTKIDKSSTGDNATGLVTEHVVGGPEPLYIRGYMDKFYKAYCTDCDNIVIRFTIDGVSLSTRQLREENAPIYRRMAGSTGDYYDHTNYTVGVPLISAPKSYAQDYTLQEDAFRILLSRVKTKLTPGTSLEMKVEMLAEKDKVNQEIVMAEGTINLKVTDQSNTIQGPNCRCGKPGMTDAALEKDVKEAFMFQFDDVKAVHKVVLLDRSFREVRDSSYAKNVIGKGMDANIIYEGNDGIVMNIMRFVFYNKEGNKFSDKISIGTHTYFVPISPTCIK